MADSCSENPETSTTTTIEESQENPADNVTILRLKLKKPKDKKRVQWTAETVDNEHLNKRKSKCCCVYVKPHAFDESSSDTDDECDHCRGHVEMRNKSDHVHSTEPSNSEDKI